MLTRERIAEGLELLALRLANNEDPAYRPTDWEPHEWAYLKGIACHAIWTTRARFVVVGQV